MVFLSLLALAVGIISLLALTLVGLFEAPWPALLVLLFTALAGLQWLTLRSQAIASPAPAPPATTVTPESPKPTAQAAVQSDGPRPNTSPPHPSQATASSPTPRSETATTGAATPDHGVASDLIYRGIHYQPASEAISPAPEPEPGPAEAKGAPPTVLEGTYRGCRWSKALPQDDRSSTIAPEEITYRGRKLQSRRQQDPSHSPQTRQD